MAKNLHIGTLTPNHIFVNNESIHTIYKGETIIWAVLRLPFISSFSATPSNIDLDPAANTQSASVTFVKQSTGIYHYSEATIRGQPTDYGSETGFSALRIASHYYIGTDGRNGAVPSNVHYYQFSIDNTDPNYRKYNAIVINGRTYALTARGSDEVTRGITTHTYWTTTSINSADFITDTQLTISIQFQVSGVGDNVSLSFNITGRPSQVTHGRIVRLPDGTAVGTNYSSASGANLTQTISATRPNQTTSYRLYARNDGGTSQQDVTVTVTQNANISNLRRTLFINSHEGNNTGNFQFKATVSGTPRPVVSWNMPDGQTGFNNSHTSFRSTGTNEWEITIGGPAGLRLGVTSGMLAVTVQNSSNSDTATIANIGN